MSGNLFPTSTTLPGLNIKITRTAMWDSIVQEAISGKETRIGRRQFPRYSWELQFNFLRSSTVFSELQTLQGFFNQRQGMFDSFLWQDPDDNSSSASALGTGDSTTVNFQLLRSYGGWVDQITAPNAISRVAIDSTNLTSTMYTFTTWTSTSALGPGILSFSSGPPTNGQAITADFTYYWPVRFTDDNMTFDKVVNLIWENSKLGFKSIL